MTTAPSEARVNEIAQQAGREAAREMLMLLGIDASTPKGIETAQRNFAFLTDLRVGTDAVKGKTLMLIVGAVFTAVMAWLTLGMSRH
jgi:GTP cyclohydrolase I